MRRPAWLVVLALALGACSARTPVVEDTPTQTAGASESPSPTRKPVPRARSAVYATPGAIWLYDVKRNSVRQVARGEGVRQPKWVSRDEISFVREEPGDSAGEAALHLLNVETRQVKELFRVETGIDVYAWSPDRQTVAYVTRDERAYPHIHYRSLSGEGSVQTVATLARALGREGADDDQARVEFARDGRRVLVVYTAADGDPGRAVTDDQAQLQLRTLDGTLAFAPDHGSEPTMGFWSPKGDRLYYRTGAGARYRETSTGRVRSLKGNPFWYDPSISRDGRFVAYDTGGSRLGVRVRVYDTRSGAFVVTSPRNLFRPVFADARTVWVQRVRKCARDCLTETEPVDEVLAFDRTTGKTRKLAIVSLRDIDVLYR